MDSVICLRRALSTGVAAALLAGCGASQSVNPTPLDPGSGSVKKQVFSYTGTEQIFRVPGGVTQITVTAIGASGQAGDGDGYGSYSAPGGLGGWVKATIPVSRYGVLQVYVGGSGSIGGFNGGATSGYSYGQGGGASDVRVGGNQLVDRVIVAGGGGGGGSAGACLETSCGYTNGGPGGSGGTVHGAAGANAHGVYAGDGGAGGRQHTGGRGGAGGSTSCGGAKGVLGAGGIGGGGSTGNGCGDFGGGGGGGYYGGGGGGGGGLYGSSISVFSGGGGGGGGGSSFVEKSASGVEMHRGHRSGDGLIIITW